jgi:L-asparaginase II
MNNHEVAEEMMEGTASSSPAVLAEAMRAEVVESRHLGHVVVVDGEGDLVASLGDPSLMAYLRSAAKPFQAIPLLTSGAAERFGFTDREVALACGSHGGEPMHVETVFSMLGKIGLNPSALQCGLHEPYDPAAKQALKEEGEQPSLLHNNCSGKHAGMLALAIHLGADVESYLELGHPVQHRILETIAAFAGVPEKEIIAGPDGCGVPTFAVPLQAMARMFAHLVRPPEHMAVEIKQACDHIVRAMMAHPEMVAGTAEGESLDTGLMQSKPGAFVSKEGAEGVFAAAILPGDAWPSGLGIVVNVEDGDLGRRARGPIAVELLRQLGLLEGADENRLEPYVTIPLTNHLEEIVGEVRPSFRLPLTRDLSEAVSPGASESENGVGSTTPVLE